MSTSTGFSSCETPATSCLVMTILFYDMLIFEEEARFRKEERENLATKKGES